MMLQRTALLLFICSPLFGEEWTRGWKFSGETEFGSGPKPNFSQFLWGDYKKSEKSRFGFAFQGRRFDYDRIVNRWEPAVGATVFFGYKQTNSVSLFAGRTFEGKLNDGQIFTPVVASVGFKGIRVVHVFDPKFPHGDLPGTLYRKTWVGRGSIWFRAEGLHIGRGIGTEFSMWGGEVRYPFGRHFHLYWAAMYDSAQKDHNKPFVTLGGLLWSFN